MQIRIESTICQWNNETADVINDYDLIVPHPHMAQRQFVLQPMVEIAPEWRHPITGLTATQMLHDLLNTSAAN